MSDACPEKATGISTERPCPEVPDPKGATDRHRWAWRDLAAQLVATSLGIGALVGVLHLGQRTGWDLTKFSTTTRHAAPEKDDWCDEHGIPESICVECSKGAMPRGKEHGWCREHGIHECPLCHPEIAPQAMVTNNMGQTGPTLMEKPV